MKISTEELSRYVVRKLGGNFWTVEIAVDSTGKENLEGVEDAINDAILTYSRWKPCKVKVTYRTNVGIQKMGKTTSPAIPEDVNGILDWRFSTSLGVSNPNIESQLMSGAFTYYNVGVGSSGLDLGYFHLLKMWVAFAGRELGSYPDLEFRLNEDTGTPELWLYSPGWGTSFEVWFSKQHKDLSTIPDYDETIIKALAMAYAKITLGEIRSKYASVPAANTPMTLNGQALKNEGAAELAAAQLSLKKSEAALAIEWI